MMTRRKRLDGIQRYRDFVRALAYLLDKYNLEVDTDDDGMYVLLDKKYRDEYEEAPLHLAVEAARLVEVPR